MFQQNSIFKGTYRLLVIICILFVLTPSFLFGDEEKDKRPERGMGVYGR